MNRRVDSEDSAPRLPVVGVGASAGGLEALRQLFHAMPADTGMAFVVVQHLSPDHPTHLAELLGGATALSVSLVRDGEPPLPNHVYICPPGYQLDLLHGRLHLQSLDGHRGMPTLIDHFFESLASDVGACAVGVVLSGAGSDGARGLAAIRAAAGITLVQSESSAAFGSMPHSAIQRGQADHVASPVGIAEELARLARSHHCAGHQTPLPFAGSEKDLGDVFHLLRAAHGTDFSLYKPSTIQRRLWRRMMLHDLSSLPDYLQLLRQQPEELDRLFDDLLINVTNFFREPETFALLERDVFPALIRNRRPDQPVRVWVPACSTGEEAYSLAISWLDCLEELGADASIQIFATDIDASAINQARRGLYPPQQVLPHLSPRRLESNFVHTPKGCQINQEVRDLCVFAVQDVLRDPPFSRLDLICCRNLLIYLKRKPQERLLQAFHHALLPGGTLVLGASESIGPSSDLFRVVDPQGRLYRRKSLPGRDQKNLLPQSFSPLQERARPDTPVAPETEIHTAARQQLMERHAPPAVTLDHDLNVLEFHGDLGNYLVPPPGQPNMQLLKLARPPLRIELNLLVHPVLETGLAATREIRYPMPSGRLHRLRLILEPIGLPEPSEPLYLLVFDDLGALREDSVDLDAEAQERIAGLEQELTRVREYADRMILKLRAANEELHRVSEENLSANEELQSINEELETAKEELQTSNDELNTLNHELLRANGELHRLAEELRQLMEAVEIPILMLSRTLHLRRFTPTARGLFSLQPGDIGRPLSDLRPRFKLDSLEAELCAVMQERSSRTLAVEDGEGVRWSLGILPLFDAEGEIDGVILRFIDLRPYLELQRQEQVLLAYLQNASEAVILEDLSGRVQSWNRGAEALYGYRADEAVGMSIFRLIPEEEKTRLRDILGRLALGERIEPFDTVRIDKWGNRKPVRLSLSLVRDQSGQPVSLVSTSQETGVSCRSGDEAAQ